MNEESIEQLVNLLHEAGMLASIPRSGFAFLGSGQQSVAEHTYRVIFVAYVLSHLSRLAGRPVKLDRLFLFCLFHDLPEARIGDLNAVQKQYVVPQVDKVLQDFVSQYPIGEEIAQAVHSFENDASLEAMLARDADQIELLLVLKREEELGNPQTQEWIKRVFSRIQTDEGKQLASKVTEVDTSAWWRLFTH